MRRVRAHGPYKHGNVWRVHFVSGSGRGNRATTYEKFATRAEAEACIAASRDEAQGVTVRQAVDRFLEHKRERGCVANTLENYEHRLWRLLGLPGNENRPIRFVAGRGGELYRASIGTGANDTHINGLNVGRMWGAWCVREKLLRANPFADVERVGRKRHGSTKERHTVDESRKLEAYCMAAPFDPDRVLTYGYMMLGKRASELVGVRVRDLDDDGWLLRIGKGKSVASVTALAVPPALREMLLGLAMNEPPDVHLFVNHSGKPMSRYVARDRVRAVCKAAGVRVLPPQALRRTFTDNAQRQGVALKSIAEMVGHTSSAVTQRSYLAPEVVASAAVERNFKVLAGGKR